MTIMNWSDLLKTECRAIDDEHRVLFDAVNEVETAVLKDPDPAAPGPLLLKLARTTRSHFASEEAAMTAAKFPGQALHELKHHGLLEQLDALLRRFNRGFALSRHSLSFLRDWLVTHIEKEDRQFGLWLSKHGKR